MRAIKDFIGLPSGLERPVVVSILRMPGPRTEDFVTNRPVAEYCMVVGNNCATVGATMPAAPHFMAMRSILACSHTAKLMVVRPLTRRRNHGQRFVPRVGGCDEKRATAAHHR